MFLAHHFLSRSRKLKREKRLVHPSWANDLIFRAFLSWRGWEKDELSELKLPWDETDNGQARDETIVRGSIDRERARLKEKTKETKSGVNRHTRSTAVNNRVLYLFNVQLNFRKFKIHSIILPLSLLFSNVRIIIIIIIIIGVAFVSRLVNQLHVVRNESLMYNIYMFFRFFFFLLTPSLLHWA